MTSIDPRAGIASALRAQAGRLGKPRARTTPPPAAARAGSSALAQRILSLDPADPDRPRQAVRLFIEHRLAQAFGPALLDDTDFPRMLQAVEEQMRQDAAAAAALQAAGERLLAGQLP
jgi:hypothetical protein